MSIRVYPGAANPSHEISLSDGVQTWGLRLDGGAEALREAPITPSTLRFNNGVTGFGEWEPGMAQIEQRDWSGGRGLDRFSAEDAASANRYYDGMNAWTMTPGKLLPAPQWKLAQGLRKAIQHLPGSVSWMGLIGGQRFLSARFSVGTTDFPAARASIWLRRVGSPGALNLAVYEDDGGMPGVAIPDSGDSVSISELVDVTSTFTSFELSSLESDLEAGLDFHLVLRASGQDNAANHWEIGVDPNKEGGHISAAGDGWTPIKSCPYYRLEDSDVNRKFLFFHFAGGFYAVDQRANGSPSHVYLNGDRGQATGWGGTRLTDSDKSWVINQWTNAWVSIVKGKGMGQCREIISNTATELTVRVWDITPDGTSDYVIYGTEFWKDISPITGDLIDGVVSDVAIVDDYALFAQGSSVPILRMRFNSVPTLPLHEFDDDGTNMADLLHSFHHPQYGPQIWRALVGIGEVSRAVPTAWLTALTFGTGIKLGDKSQGIVELFDLGGQLLALKADSLWYVGDDDRGERVNVGLSPILPMASHRALTCMAGQVLFGWRHALLIYSGGSLTDIGPGREQGLPPSREGVISGLQPMGVERLAASVDANDGQSSVMVWQAGAWHELMRAPRNGQRIQNIGYQDFEGMRPRIWISLGGDLAYVEMPRNSENPLGDIGLCYQHEAVLVGGTVDMGAARLPKFLKEMTLVSQNLGTGLQVNLDYQLDAEIGGAHWRNAGAFYSSPLDTLALNVGQLHSIRTRLRLLSSQATIPPVVQATVLEGFARTPLKYQWTLRIQVADLQSDRSGGLDADPDTLIAWLQEAARQARKIHMRSIWQALDDKNVIVEPPTLLRQFGNSSLSWWGGTASIILREA